MSQQYLFTDRPRADQNTFFFSEESMQIISRLMTLKTVKAGVVLYENGDPADKWYFIFKGEVKLFRHAGEARERVLHMMKSGDLFGEGFGLASYPYTCGAVTMEESVLGELHRTDLEKLIGWKRDFSLDLLKWSSLMDRIMKTKLRDVNDYGNKGAVCSTLIRLAKSYGVEQGNSITITKTLTNTAIGNYIGSSRESVNRILAELKKEQVISQNEGLITIHDLTYLKQACRCEECPPGICRM